jgi:hypothetical protein
MAETQEAQAGLGGYTFDARPDTLDFRDRMYEPTLVEVPTRMDLSEYQRYRVPILNQGSEGACTGFGLATVANYLLRKRKIVPDPTPVSPRMLYEMARRYDEWPGENYSGSSARGAMKGWHKHGVCAQETWPYTQSLEDVILTYPRVMDAATRPLGAYYRVNHKDLIAMHSALAEVGVLFATGWVHDGWGNIGSDGTIPYEKGIRVRGGHAFAIVAYDERGFWVQNSWGENWGQAGFAQISYDDWLVNGTDVWVARLGVPVRLRYVSGSALTLPSNAGQAGATSFFELHPHIVSIAEDGGLDLEGTFASSENEVQEIFQSDLPRISADWEKKRLLIYIPGGLAPFNTFLQRSVEYRKMILDAQVYPLILNWNMDFWSTISAVLQDALCSRRPEGVISGSMDFMLNRLDDTLEPLVHSLMGNLQWEKIRKRAYLASAQAVKSAAAPGGVRIVLKHLAEWVHRTPGAEIHLVSHSLGSLLCAPLVRLLTSTGRITHGMMRGDTGLGVPLSTVTLWAPTLRIDEFNRSFLPAIRSHQIRRFALYTLVDQAEQDDNVAKIYNKSLLYLISNALEQKRGQPLLGLEKAVQQDSRLAKIFSGDLSGRGDSTYQGRQAEWVRAPNNAPHESRWASTATRHGDFDDDMPTLRSTMVRILEQTDVPAEIAFTRSEASLREKRIQLDHLTRKER